MRTANRILKLSFACAALSVLTGCMTYTGYPENPPAVTAERRQATLHYKIEGNAMFAGPTAIREAIAVDAPFQSVTPAEKPQSAGDYLSVKIEQNAPTVTATVFGYISYATLTILPFWSTQDGSTLTYTLYSNGTNLKSKECIIRRKTFVWLPMILVAWVNALTPSEAEAFKACTKDFLGSI